jgi:flagellar protein FlbD
LRIKREGRKVIRVTRFNGSILYVNAELVQTVEGAPDTVITLTNNIKIVVKESAETIVSEIISYQREVHKATLISRPGE